MSLEYTPIKSSNISGYAYDNGTLTVLFTNGGVYRYFDVKPSLVEEFAKADSAGRFFASSIKSAHKFEKVDQSR